VCFTNPNSIGLCQVRSTPAEFGEGRDNRSDAPAKGRIATGERTGNALLLTALIRLTLFLLTIAATATAQTPKPASTPQARDNAGVPQLLTFDELVELYEQDIPAARLQQKLDALLTTPFVDNSMKDRGGIPIRPFVAGLGPSLRIVQWNIERGIELPAITAALSGAKAFETFVDRSRYPEDARRSTAILKQADALRDADVIILNEVDWGLKRSGYQFVAKELAAALNMNYAYGVEFVEVDRNDRHPWDAAGMAPKVDRSKVRWERQPWSGRPRTEDDIESLVVQMAVENRAWGYTRIVGALLNLGHNPAAALWPTF
jgi:hypothetical protein